MKESVQFLHNVGACTATTILQVYLQDFTHLYTCITLNKACINHKRNWPPCSVSKYSVQMYSIRGGTRSNRVSLQPRIPSTL